MDASTELRAELIDTGLFPIFEIEVRDLRTGKRDYLIFDIWVRDGAIEASHDSLNEEQSKSNKVAYVSIDIDEGFGLNWHLEELHHECTCAIIGSEYYELI